MRPPSEDEARQSLAHVVPTRIEHAYTGARNSASFPSDTERQLLEDPGGQEPTRKSTVGLFRLRGVFSRIVCLLSRLVVPVWMAGRLETPTAISVERARGLISFGDHHIFTTTNFVSTN